MNRISFSEEAWEEYLSWQSEDKKTLKKINQLLQDIIRNGPLFGLGKPEPLTGSLSGKYSRRINEADRLVYEIEGEQIIILQCRGHYDD
ncbi:MAG: Txe/YoeB family addiction module toxin [Cloacibacillus sp.]